MVEKKIEKTIIDNLNKKVEPKNSYTFSSISNNISNNIDWYVSSINNVSNVEKTNNNLVVEIVKN